MNLIFIKKDDLKIGKKGSMQSEIQQFTVGFDEYDIREDYMKGVQLFEEFSGRSITKVIKERRLRFKGFNGETER